MGKALPATCENGVVKFGELPVPGVTILSEGVAPSGGILILEEEGKTYLAKTTPDLKSTLEKVATALQSVVDALQAIDGAGYVITVTGATGIPSPPVAASNISAVSTAITAINTLKAHLK